MKRGPVKKILASVLAAALAVSTLPLAFAAGGTEPVQQSSGANSTVTDLSHYVSMGISLQNFTFIQTKDDEQFTFSTTVSAKKNASFNYGWLYNENYHSLTGTIGKSSTLSWPDGVGGGLGTGITNAVAEVDFTGNGGATYSVNLRVVYDGRSTSMAGSNEYSCDFPLSITVLDKRALNSAIAAATAASAEKDYYIDYLWADVETALTAANALAGNVIDTQKKIDNAATQLQSAVDALQYQSADYTALDSAKAAAKAILDTENVDQVYTAATLATLREKYTAATNVSADLTIKDQATVTTAATELQSAVDAMLKFANYSIMQSAIDAFGKLDANYFDPAEISALAVEINNARTEIASGKKGADEQADVTARGIALLTKVNSLKMLDADYDALNTAVANGTEKLASEDIENYTQDSINALVTAVYNGQHVETGLKINKQADIDALTQAINTALAGLTLKGADYSALDAAITAAENALNQSDISDYTDSSVGSLRTQLTAAKSVRDDATLTIEDQAQISAAADSLNAAVSALVLKDADMTALTDAIAKREQELAAAKQSGTYTDASIARLETAIAAAQSVANNSYTIKQQSIVDDAVTALNAVKLEGKEADYTQLKALIVSKTAELEAARDDDRVSQASKDALEQAIKDAQAVVDADYGVEQQGIINQAVADLNAVVLDWDDADYTRLNAAIEAANAAKNGADYAYYTEASISTFEAALSAAEGLDKNLDVRSQSTINSTAAVLESATAGLTLRPADFTALNEALSARRTELADAKSSGNYTQESLTALENAINTAQDVSNNASLTAKDQATVDNAVKDLNAVQLVLKDADYTDLDNLIEQADALLADPDTEALYTAESVQNLKDQLAAAKAVARDLKITDQATVDTAAEALRGALTLQYKDADLTALKAAIDAANAKLNAADIGNYTDASVKELRDAVQAAQELYDSNPNITKQQEVTTTAENLNAMTLVLKDADYTKLTALIAENEAKLQHPERYTEASVTAMREALNEAQAVVDAQYKITDQQLVDNAYDALAAVKLVENPADYTALDAAIAAAEAKLQEDLTNYTEESIQALRDALAAAQAILRDQLSGYQDTIDAATDALTGAMELTLKRADMTGLQEAVTAANAKLNAADIADYTDASVEALQTAVDAAQELLDNPPAITEQAAVDQKAADLNAMELVLKGADYTALTEAKEAAAKILDNNPEALYTAATLEALKNAVEAGNQVAEDLTIKEQATVENAAKAITDAISGLTYLDADLTELQAAVTAANAKLNAADIGNYTDASVKELTDAVKDAQALIDRKPNITEQELVTNTAADLNAMELVLKGADYTALNAAITAAEAQLKDTANYTDASVQALKDAIATAKAVVDAQYDITKQSTVDDAVAALQAVQLVLKDADYTDLDNLIEQADALLADPDTEALYTAESVQNLKDQLAAAKAVARDLKITDQATVDTAAEALKGALTLQYKDADLTALQEAVEAAEDRLAAEDITDYTDASVQNLKDVLAQAQELLDSKPLITDQDAVDQMAEELNGVELVLKGADYTDLDKVIDDLKDKINSGDYKGDDLDKLKDALDEAEKVDRDLSIKEQDQIDSMVDHLQEVLDSIKDHTDGEDNNGGNGDADNGDTDNSDGNGGNNVDTGDAMFGIVTGAAALAAAAAVVLARKKRKN